MRIEEPQKQGQKQEILIQEAPTQIEPVQDYVEEKDLAETLEQITPFVQAISPLIIEYYKLKSPQVKRYQYINFIIMLAILGSVSTLAYHKIIDSAAATGLIGAVVGYVFGGLYQQSK
ncbi:MAG: hypothetical protein FIB07_02685 [Candidatus Methanoperedens sp.]|nr:hypothetical protein [Candidatus Methanoperedens sp.]